MLRMEVPRQWQAGGSYLMNQRTFALLMTMSDTSGSRCSAPCGTCPVFRSSACQSTSLVRCQMSSPARLPAYGDWPQTYLVVTRRATTRVTDPSVQDFVHYSA